MEKLTQSIVHDTISPASVYSTTVMRTVDGDEKILMVSSEKSNMITVESKLVAEDYVTSIVDLNFPNIPSESD